MGYKQNDKCRGFDNDQAQCERKGCEFVETDDFSDCDITTTETPTTTVTPGCCKGTSRTSNDACNAIEDPDQCDRRSSCTFIAFGILEEDCVFPPTEPPSEPGCCYGNPDIAYSKRWMDQCKKFGTEEECLMLTNDDGEPRCYFKPLGEYEDCETVWPTTTTTTEEIGCCYADSYKANDKCGNKVGRDQCERSGKCEFREGKDADCSFVQTTTTSEPWLGAKDEAVLFAEQGTVLSEAMNTQISLSTLLLLAAVALAAQQLYKWCYSSRSGYTKLDETTTAETHTLYQMA